MKTEDVLERNGEEGLRSCGVSRFVGGVGSSRN